VTPTLFPPYIVQLQAEAAGVDNAAACLARSMLEAVRGETGARFTLRRAVALAEADGPAVPPPLLRKSIIGAVLCRDEETCEALLARAGSGGRFLPRVRLGCADGPTDSADVVMCEVPAQGAISFALPASLYATPHLPQLVTRWVTALPLFEAYAGSGQTKTGRVAFNVAFRQAEPGLAYCGVRADAALIPDPEFISSLGHQRIRHRLAEEGQPWAERRPVAFWRGPKDSANLCAFVQGLAHGGLGTMYDVALAGPASYGAEHWQACRYALETDSAAAGSAGLLQKLLAGSTVLKVQADATRMWLHERMRPWEHFVPVAANLSDLEKRMAWLAAHEAEAEAIGRQGRALALAATFEAELTHGCETIAAALGDRVS
jgi:hypothetical protein